MIKSFGRLIFAVLRVCYYFVKENIFRIRPKTKPGDSVVTEHI
jgi:hypothetical protein